MRKRSWSVDDESQTPPRKRAGNVFMSPVTSAARRLMERARWMRRVQARTHALQWETAQEQLGKEVWDLMHMAVEWTVHHLESETKKFVLAVENGKEVDEHGRLRFMTHREKTVWIGYLIKLMCDCLMLGATWSAVRRDEDSDDEDEDKDEEDGVVEELGDGEELEESVDGASESE